MLRPSFWRPLVVFSAAFGALLAADPSAAQTPTESEFSGTVRSVTGEPIQRAVISLRDLDGQVVRSFEGGLDGNFVLRGLGMGRYDVRVEALGFRPQVVTGVVLRPGAATRLTVVLGQGGAGVDTTRAAGASAGSAVDRWFDASELAAWPGATPALDSWLPLATTTGEGLGMAGLPGAHTSVFIDGLPFRPVMPFGLRESDRALGIATGRSIAAVQLSPVADGLALRAGAGGRISIHSQRGGQPGSGFDVAGSAGPLRGSEADPADAPGALSLQAGGLASLAPESSPTSVVLGADVWQVERPRAGLLASDGDVDGVTAPWVEQRRGAAAFARFDRAVDGGSVWGTARLAVQPGVTDLTGMAWGLADTGERIDLLAGGGLIAPVGRREVLDVRLGVTRSAWSSAAVAGAELPFEAGAPTFLDAATGLRGGPGPIEAESANRLDADLIATMVVDRGAHRLQGGLRAGVGAHAQEFGHGAWVESQVGTGSPAAMWAGSFDARRYRGERTVTVPRFGAFAEDLWTAREGVAVRVGAAFDSEWLPVVDVRPNSDWFVASGLRPAFFEEQITGVSGYADFEWTGEYGAARLGASYESHSFDPSLLIELLNSTDYEVYSGPDAAPWPDVAPGASSPNSIVPGYRHLLEDPVAPSTLRFSGSVSGGGGPARLSVGAVFRRSDGLTRRRDLNRAAVPHGTDRNGRPLWAQPSKVGAWLGADPATAGRFEQFGPVWELDQGGWSEYLGVTGRMTVGAPGGLQVGAEYTWSRTEDNVPGLASQGMRQGVSLEAAAGDDATEGVSDLDRPHRATGLVSFPLPIGTGSRLSAIGRFMSGAPFTPGYAAGVDANLDGVSGNDAAFVADAAAGTHGDWDCLDDDRGAFATRNGCRAADVKTLDLRLELGLPGAGVRLFVDAFNVLDERRGLLDTALLRVDSDAGLPAVDGSTALPFEVNPGFGSDLADRSTGRMLRVGLRVVR
ncbi:carboxypeptidase-like regulatory domain-containing protein [Gemmatimonadota bacterium DH-20]|uniref:Carboxypeptidase-like regulatory domain-containing protein n=1 Tax=Gaopeijia maritima TaxID=3119007 RepID=A0ABU9E3X2_9BACT